MSLGRFFTADEDSPASSAGSGILTRVSKKVSNFDGESGFRELEVSKLRPTEEVKIFGRVSDSLVGVANISCDPSSSSVSSSRSSFVFPVRLGSDEICGEAKCSGLLGRLNAFAPGDVKSVQLWEHRRRDYSPLPNAPHSPAASCTLSSTRTSEPV